MRWPITTPDPTRTVVRFAWLPVVTDDGMRVWLERYRSYEVVTTATGVFGLSRMWHVERRETIGQPWR